MDTTALAKKAFITPYSFAWSDLRAYVPQDVILTGDWFPAGLGRAA
jgi:hypothetical protein